MRIEELKREIESLARIYVVNMVVEKKAGYLFVTKCEQRGYSTIATVLLKNEFRLNTNTKTFEELPKKLKEELFNILVEFARKPEKEREEEKRYRYRLKSKYLWIDKRLNLANCYLNIQSFQDGSEQKVLDNRGNTNSFKAEFTDEEIKEVVEKFDVDLEMFDKIEEE